MPGNRDVLLGTIFKSQYKRVIKPGDYLPYFIDIYNIAFVCSQKSVAAQFLLQLFQRRANFKNPLLRENQDALLFGFNQADFRLRIQQNHLFVMPNWKF